jgi:predicted acetyltransferase
MDIKIEPILVEQKSVFVQLMELCNYDFSEYEDSDVNEYGYYGYSHIDDYWNENGRFPYFIRVNGKIAGFALVCSHCRYINSSQAHNISEFFVMLKYRRKGIGSYVAKKVFDMHKGQWEVLQLPTNVRAQKFWKTIISEYTNGAYKECGSIADGSIGFLFDNSLTLQT